MELKTVRSNKAQNIEGRVITKGIAEINEIKTKKEIQNISKTNSLFF
jgi:hypothetical protein